MANEITSAPNIKPLLHELVIAEVTVRYAERMKEKWDRERRERSVKEIKGEKQNLLR